MTCYLNVPNQSIQYEDWEDLIQLDYEEDYIDNLRLDEIREIVREEVEKATDYHFNYF